MGSAVYWCRDKQRVMELNNRAMFTVRWWEGGGGSVEEEKDFGKPPCQFLMYWGGICILKNIVKYCKILYLKYVLIV